MTKEHAQRILFDAMVEHVYVTDDPQLREALETLCPHTTYVHGGSMGDVCQVCGLMPPDREPCAPQSLDSRPIFPKIRNVVYVPWTGRYVEKEDC